jgi:hypothetical protein
VVYRVLVHRFVFFAPRIQSCLIKSKEIMNGLFIMFIVVTALFGLFNGYINNKVFKQND